MAFLRSNRRVDSSTRSLSGWGSPKQTHCKDPTGHFRSSTGERGRFVRRFSRRALVGRGRSGSGNVARLPTFIGIEVSRFGIDSPSTSADRSRGHEEEVFSARRPNPPFIHVPRSQLLVTGFVELDRRPEA